MTPIQEAKFIYYDMGWDWLKDCSFFSMHGYIHSDDKAFFFFQEHPKRYDAWAIQLAVGDMTIWGDIMPFHLPYTIWGREIKGLGERVRNTDRLIQLLKSKFWRNK